MKYEKPKLVDINRIAEAKGSGISSPDCAGGYAVTDTCPGGPNVTPGCVDGGIQQIECGGGGSITGT